MLVGAGPVESSWDGSLACAMQSQFVAGETVEVTDSDIKSVSIAHPVGIGPGCCTSWVVGS
ncbi:hypothetical protein [Amycolatopsis magusensis]|uniref:hypothetical protein n=1 Tax=Amycolatopsis magusensis TaxID=882444 RepID=UPI003C304E7D